MPNRCHHCRKSFEASRKTQAYCSRNCRIAHQKETARAEGKCPGCRKEYPEPGKTTCEKCIDGALRRQARRLQSRSGNAIGASATCKRCGGEFNRNSSTQRFCSAACRSQEFEAKRDRKFAGVNLTCSVCAAPFTPWRNGQKTCGAAECKATHIRTAKLVERGLDPAMLDPRPCVECGREFKPRQSNHYTCSTECGAKLAKANASKRWHAGRSGFQGECAQCAKPFTARYPLQIYCGKTCRQAAKRARDAAIYASKPCEVCGEEFQPASKTQILCSVECREQRRRDQDYDRYEPHPRGPTQAEKDVDRAIVMGARFTEKETKSANDFGHWLVIHADWYRKHSDQIEACAVRPPPLTPRELYRRGVGLRQQIRQWLGERKSIGT